MNGSLGWHHVGTTDSFRCFWLGKGRSDVMADRVDIVVHDRWPSYRKHQSKVQHASCLAHLVRECKGLAELGEEWAKDMVALLYEMMEADATSRQGGFPIPEKDIVSMEKRFDQLLQVGFDDHQYRDPLPKSGRGRCRPGHNLLHRLRDNRERMLLCLHHQDVPATNNMAKEISDA